AALLKTEVDLAAIPVELRAIVERCLRKDVRRRWRDMGDVRVALDEGGAEAPPRTKALPPWLAIAALAMIALAGWWIAWRAMRRVEYPLVRLSVDLGPDALTGPRVTAAISPDGTRIVFPARGPTGREQLATRLLNQPQSVLLAGTENGVDPFFSPDSQW